MVTLLLAKRYGKQNKLLDFKVRSLRNSVGSGYTWNVIFEDNTFLNTLYNSRGKDSFSKKQLEVKYNEDNKG